jgi:hypothetical protein
MASTGLTGEESTGKERRGEIRERGGRGSLRGYRREELTPRDVSGGVELDDGGDRVRLSEGGEGLHGGAGSQRRGGGVSSCDGTAEARMRV